MNRIKIFLTIFLFLLLLGGCSNKQNSSREEACFVIQHFPDFQEQIQYFSVESMGFIVGWPNVYQSSPKLKGESRMNDRLVHIVIYKTKSGSFKMVLLNDSRPPNILDTKEFK